MSNIFNKKFSKLRKMSYFAQNLKILRKEKGLSQKQVALKLGVVESCYANWEQGRTEPSISMLRKLCEIFVINVDELIN